MEDLSQILYQNNLNKIRQNLNNFSQKIQNIPQLKYDPTFFEQSRPEQLQRMLQITNLLYQNEKLETIKENYQYTKLWFPDILPLFENYLSFLEILESLANEEQLQQWKQEIINHKIIGAYCLPELSQGNNVENLKTFAKYDRITDEFIINTQDIKGIKFGIEQMGVMSNFAIIFALLIIDKVQVGVQPFMVQIRDLKTHRPLKGIQIGDIGLNYGSKTQNYGFLMLKNVRIPRKNMLMKYIYLNEQGELQMKGTPKIIQSDMVNTKIKYPWDTYISLSYACKIFYNYLKLANSQEIFREKNVNIDNEQSLIFQQKQEVLIKSVSQCYAFFFLSQELKNQQQIMLKKVHEENDFSMVTPLQSILSGIKAYTTDIGLETVQNLQKNAENFGLSEYSGFGVILRFLQTNQNTQGNNNILNQQCARFLIKNFQNFTNEKKKGYSPELNFFQKYYKYQTKNKDKESQGKYRSKIQSEQDINLEEIYNILLNLTVYKIDKTYKHYKKGNKLLKNEEQSWNEYAQSQIISTCQIFSQFYTFSAFKNQIKQLTDSDKITLRTSQILENVACIYGINIIQFYLVTVYQCQYINIKQLEIIIEYYQNMLFSVSFNLNYLIDAFQINENQLITFFKLNQNQNNRAQIDNCQSQDIFDKFTNIVKIGNELNSSPDFQQEIAKIWKRKPEKLKIKTKLKNPKPNL